MKGKLEFNILKCEDFTAADHYLLDGNYYVKLAFNGKLKQTQKIKNSKNLEWNYRDVIKTDNKVSDNDKVHFSLCFKSPRSDALVGTKILGLKDLMGTSISERKIEILDQSENFVGNLIVQCNWITDENYVDETDFIGRNLYNFTGPRPHLLRVESYYSIFKNVYFAVAGFPIINKVSPIVENIIEGILQKTPLKCQSDSPEKGDEKSRIVDNIDRAIDKKLNEVDDFFDDSKDFTIKKICDAKNAIKNIKPKDKSILEATIDGVSYTTDATKNFVVGTVSGTVSGISGFVGGIFGKTKEQEVTPNKIVEVVNSKAREATEFGYNTAGKVSEMARNTGENVKQSISKVVPKVASVIDDTKKEFVPKATSAFDSTKEEVNKNAKKYEKEAAEKYHDVIG